MKGAGLPSQVCRIVNLISLHSFELLRPVNPGSTEALTTAIANANSSYNGSLAVTAYAAEARNENS